MQDIDPFAGAGWVEHSWSFATSLRPAGGGEGRVRIDSAALNQRVHDAVVGLRDQRLSEGERIPNVFVVPYVAADGNRSADDPLIDPADADAADLGLGGDDRGDLGESAGWAAPLSAGGGSGQRQGHPYAGRPARAARTGLRHRCDRVRPPGRRGRHALHRVRVDRDAAGSAALPPGRQPAPGTRPGPGGPAHADNFLRDNVLGPVYLARLGWETLRLPGRMARSARRADGSASTTTAPISASASWPPSARR